MGGRLIMFMMCMSMLFNGGQVATEEVKDEREYVALPVLMYHHVSEDPNNGMTVAPDTFEKDVVELLENGYTPVLIEEIVDFVDDKGNLPEKPVCITFDDGYLSNYELAFPILKKYNAKANVAVIGVSVGATEYKGTGVAIIPHFDYDVAREMEKSGLVSIFSHTYDMHQSESLESGDYVRNTICRLEHESEDEYEAFLKNDFEKIASEIKNELGKDTIAVAYPLGKSSETTAEVLKELGVRVTFSTTSGSNLIKKGEPDSLFNLCRYTMSEEFTVEDLLQTIN